MPLPLPESDLTEQLKNVLLRRSCRKRRQVMIPSLVYRKKRKSGPSGDIYYAVTPVKCPVPSLDQLPQPVLDNLFLFLQVESLENLGATCSFFNQMINGRFLLYLDFPFHSSFLQLLEETVTIEKKPLLKLRCKKTMLWVCPTARNQWETNRNTSMQLMVFNIAPSQSLNYLMRSQMCLLSLSYLRELDLVPETFRDSFFSDSNIMFDKTLINELQRQGNLNQLTKLSIMQDHMMFLQHYIWRFTSLIELNLTILTRTNLRLSDFYYYVDGLENLVSKCEAKFLNITVEAETRNKRKKLLISSKVEKLTVTGPCSFNLTLIMPNLRLLNVQYQDVHVCSYWNFPIHDRILHRCGKCCVSIAYIVRNCPKLEKFVSIDVARRTLSPSQWFQKMKKNFYEDYQKGGGSMNLPVWQRKRWFQKCDLMSINKI